MVKMFFSTGFEGNGEGYGDWFGDFFDPVERQRRELGGGPPPQCGGWAAVAVVPPPILPLIFSVVRCCYVRYGPDSRFWVSQGVMKALFFVVGVQIGYKDISIS